MKNNYFFKNLIIPLLFFLGLLSYDLQAQTTDAFDSGSGATWTVPAGVFSVQVKVWGSGGAGGGGSASGHENGGGGSGGYAVRTYAVTPGQTFTYTVGGSVAGDADGGATGNASSTTWSGGGGFATMTANGGNGGSSGNTAAGGTGGTQSNGDTGSSTGGSGNIGVNNSNGGKGGDAPGSGGTGGLAQSTGNTAGNPGNAPGGGGGGSRGAANGGEGAAGRVSFTYTVVMAPEINVTGNSVSIVDGDATPSTTDHTDFGTANVSGGTVIRTFTIQNLGGTALNIAGSPRVVITGTNAADYTLTTVPSASVAAGGSTTFQITFDPSGAGTRTATLTITTDDSDEGTFNFDISGVGGIPEMNITGNGNNIADGDGTPTSTDHTDFGSVGTGSTVVRTFTIQNTGTSALTIGTITIGGADAANFTVTSSPAASVAAGGTTTFQVTFAPTVVGSKSATISIVNDDSDENPYNYSISGTATLAAIVDTYSSGTSQPWTVPCTVTSVLVKMWGAGGGGGGSNSDGSGAGGGASGAYFTKTLAVTPGEILTYSVGNGGIAGSAPGGNGLTGGSSSLTHGVTTYTANGGSAGYGDSGGAAPQGNGGVASSLPVGGDVGTSAGNAGSNGTASGGSGGSAPNGGAGGVGGTNTIGAAGTVPGGGGAGGEFGPGNNAGGNGANGRISFEYFYSNPDIDVSGNSISIVSGDVTPSISDFTNFGTGATLSRTFTISNVGGGTMNLGALAISGADAANFSITSSPTATVPCTAPTTFTVSFTQGGNYVHNATITIPTDDPDESSYTFAISATGIPAGNEINVKGNSSDILSGDITPSTSDYTDFGTGTVSTFTIHNNGTSDLNITGITFTGTHAANFVVSDGSGSYAIAAGSSRDITITFVPVSTLTHTAIVNIASNDIDEATYTFAIQGQGIAAEISVSGKSVDIVNGDATPTTSDNTNFGSVYTGSSWVRTFRISNSGTVALGLTGTPRITLAGSANFVVTVPSVTSVAGNSFRDFDITYTPSGLTTDTAVVTILNSDSDEGTFTFTIQGTGIAGTAAQMPGCLGDSSPNCFDNLSNSTFTTDLTGWTSSRFVADAGAAKWSGLTEVAGNDGYLRQTITGLTSSSNTVLIKFKMKIVNNTCSATGRSLDLNVKFAGSTYLTARLEDTQSDAYFILDSGAFLIATDAVSIKTYFKNCTAANTANPVENVQGSGCLCGGGRADSYTTVYLSIPKGVGVTSGELAFEVDNPSPTTGGGGVKIRDLDLYLDELEITADAASCGFLWLKADAGTGAVDGGQVQDWEDQSILANDASQATVTSRPTLDADAINFNPALLFDGSNDFMSGAGGYSSGTKIVVMFSPSTITSGTASATLIGDNITGVATDVSGLKIGAFSSTVSNETFGVLRGTAAAGHTFASRNAFTFNKYALASRTNTSTPTDGWVFWRNGSTGTLYTGGSGYREFAGRKYTLGASPNETYASWSEFYNGYIAEVITYPSRLSDTEFAKVNTYLCIKYGLSMSANFTRGTGSVVYTVSGYGNRIIGIGREDCQGLHQRQSKSENTAAADDLFTIGYNGIIGTTNSTANGNDLPDNTFLIMGDNNGSIATWTSTDAPRTNIPESTRVTRLWRVSSTGTITAPIRFKLNGTKLPAPIGSAERIALLFSVPTSAGATAASPSSVSSANIIGASFTGTSVIVPMTLIGTDWVCDYTFPSNATRYMTIVKYNDCYTDLICINGTTTWNGSAWSNGAPTVYKRAILSGNYNTTPASAGGPEHPEFHSCRLQIDNGVTLTIANDKLIKVESDVVNNGSVIIANNGSLMQFADSAVNSGTGSITVTRTSTPMYVGDYTYWSSPVTGFDLSGIPKNRAYYRNAVTNTWVSASGVMQSGFGYIVMTDNASKTVATNTSVTFSGTMNNGRVNQPVVINASKWNLLGNPYPSGLDALDFVTDNAGLDLNADGDYVDTGEILPTIGGSLYFWTHNTRIDKTNFSTTGLKGSFTQNDYAVWNVSGGIATASAETIGVPVYDSGGALISGGGNSAAPTGEIATGQAFFVEALRAGTVTFKNCQRTTVTAKNNHFYKTKNNESENKDRFWLDVENEGGAFKQILLGYFDGATDGEDILYDAKLRNGDNKVALYTTTKSSDGLDSKLSIQGKALPVKDSDVIPVGFIARDGADAKNRFSLSKTEGVFKNKDIFLIDKLTGASHNLKTSPYEFESELGEFADRFEIRYQNVSSTELAEIMSKITVSTGSGKISIRTKDSALNTIKIYNVLGGLIYETEVSGTSQIHDVLLISPKNQVLIVVTTLANGEKSTNKIIY